MASLDEKKMTFAILQYLCEKRDSSSEEDAEGLSVAIDVLQEAVRIFFSML